jgi:hypothetical protein
MDEFLDYAWNFTTPLSVVGLIALLSGLLIFTWRWVVLAKDLTKPQPSSHRLIRDPTILLSGCFLIGGFGLSVLIFTLRIILPTGP